MWVAGVPQSNRFFKIQGAPVPIDQPPDSPNPTGQDPYDNPLREMQHGGAPATREQAEPPAPAPADPPNWILADTLCKLMGYVLDDDIRVNRFLKIFLSVMASVTILLAILLVVAVLAPDAHVWIKLGGAILGVGASGGVFAYLRRRMARKSAGTGQIGPTGGTKE